MECQGTQSEKNLHAALMGESLARNKYTFYAMAAREAGLDEIAGNFERLAKNEMMHAKFWFEQLYGTPDDIRRNLLGSLEGELKEAGQMYPAFAKQAREDGLEGLAKRFESVARIEEEHAKQFMRMLQDMGSKDPGPDSGTAKGEPQKPTVGYRCQFCGAIFPERPDVCGVCQAIGSFEYCE